MITLWMKDPTTITTSLSRVDCNVREPNIVNGCVVLAGPEVATGYGDIGKQIKEHAQAARIIYIPVAAIAYITQA